MGVDILFFGGGGEHAKGYPCGCYLTKILKEQCAQASHTTHTHHMSAHASHAWVEFETEMFGDFNEGMQRPVNGHTPLGKEQS